MRSMLFALAALIVPCAFLAAPGGAVADTSFNLFRGVTGGYSSGGSGCCNSCGCDTACCDCCDCGPNWTVRAGALYLHRQRSPAQTLVIDNSLSPLLDASDLDFGFNPGWEIGVIRRINCDWSIEARYFDISDWSSTASVTGAGGSGILYEDGQNLGVFDFFAPAGTTDLRYTSSLENVELNLRRCANDWLTLIGGFRYINIDDRIQAVSAIGGDQTFQQITGGGNDLFGGQLGADACLWQRSCFRVDALGKAGLYVNDADSSFAATANFAPLDTASAVGDTQVAFVGELALTATCQLTCHWAVRAGYQLLWIEGVALASEQPIVNPAPQNGPADTIDTTDGLFYHGFTGGLEFTW